MKEPDSNSLILLPKISLKVRRQIYPDSSPPFLHTILSQTTYHTWINLIFTTNTFPPNLSLRILIYNSHQGINSLSNLKWLIRSCLEHLTRYELRFWSSTSWLFSTPSFLFFLFNFLVILCSQVFIPSISSKSWMGSQNVSVSLLISQEWV